MVRGQEASFPLLSSIPLLGQRNHNSDLQSASVHASSREALQEVEEARLRWE